MVKYAPRKVYIRESGGYVELSYTEFCRCRESDQTYMDKLFIPIQGCLLEVVREQYTDFVNTDDRAVCTNSSVFTHRFLQLLID